MDRCNDLIRIGRHHLRFIYQPGVYVFTKRRGGGRVAPVVVGECEDIATYAKRGLGDFTPQSFCGVGEAIIFIERDPVRPLFGRLDLHIFRHGHTPTHIPHLTRSVAAGDDHRGGIVGIDARHGGWLLLRSVIARASSAASARAS